MLRHPWSFPENATEDDTSLRRRHLDGRLDALEAVRRDGIQRRPLDELEIAKSREVQAEVLERVGRLIDKKHI